MSKFTKGKWKADDAGEYIFAGDMMVAQMRGWGYMTGTLQLAPEEAIEIQKANAKLVEAAPELLSLSRRLLFYAYKQCKAVEEPYKYEIKAVIDEAEKLFARVLGEEVNDEQLSIS